MAKSRYRQYLARLRSCFGAALRLPPSGNNTRFFFLLFFLCGMLDDGEEKAVGVNPSKVKILGLVRPGAPVRAHWPPRAISWRRFFIAWYFCLMRITARRVEEMLERLGAGLPLPFSLFSSSISVSPSSSSSISPSNSPSVWEAEMLLSRSLICREEMKDFEELHQCILKSSHINETILNLVIFKCWWLWLKAHENLKLSILK